MESLSVCKTKPGINYLCAMENVATAKNTKSAEEALKHLSEYTKPISSVEGGWKNTKDLDQIMMQYDKDAANGFRYWGTHAINFQCYTHNFKIREYSKITYQLLKDGYLGADTAPLSQKLIGQKSLFAMILNHDIINNRGTHWVSVVVRLRDDNVEFTYYDSVGTELLSLDQIKGMGGEWKQVLKKLGTGDAAMFSPDQRKLLVSLNVWLFFCRVGSLSAARYASNDREVEGQSTTKNAASNVVTFTTNRYPHMRMLYSSEKRQSNPDSGECGQYAVKFILLAIDWMLKERKMSKKYTDYKSVVEYMNGSTDLDDDAMRALRESNHGGHAKITRRTDNGQQKELRDLSVWTRAAEV